MLIVFFILSVCECCTFFLINRIFLYKWNSKAQNFPIGMLFLLWAVQMVSDSWQQKHRVPDTYYINSNYANVIKFMKISSNSTQNRQKAQKAQIRIGRKKMQTCINPYCIEKNNDYTRIIHEIQFCGSFKHTQFF